MPAAGKRKQQQALQEQQAQMMQMMQQAQQAQMMQMMQQQQQQQGTAQAEGDGSDVDSRSDVSERTAKKDFWGPGEINPTPSPDSPPLFSHLRN